MLTGVGETLQVNANTPLTLQKVATLVAQDPSASKDDFTARIDWGDGFQSNGVVADTGTPGTFQILGSHTYVGHQDAQYKVTVYITDRLGSKAEADGTANVTFVPPPQSNGTAPRPTRPARRPGRSLRTASPRRAGSSAPPARRRNWATGPSASP